MSNAQGKKKRVKTHQLKCWPGPFLQVLIGNKKHEVRVNDRGFQKGDFLRLREWVPDTKKYTGVSIKRKVTYITEGGTFGLPGNLCVMSLTTCGARRPK